MNVAEVMTPDVDVADPNKGQGRGPADASGRRGRAASGRKRSLGRHVTDRDLALHGIAGDRPVEHRCARSDVWGDLYCLDDQSLDEVGPP